MRTVFFGLRYIAGVIAVASSLTLFAPAGIDYSGLLFGVNTARAETGVGGLGATEPTVQKISLYTFLRLSRSQVKLLRILNGRPDTKVEVEGFGNWAVGIFLRAAENDLRTIKIILRSLIGVKGHKARSAILKGHLARQDVRLGLLEKDVKTTEAQISKEENRLGGKVVTGFGTLVVKSPRQKVLEEILADQKTRLKAAQNVREFIRIWSVETGLGE